MLSLVAFSFGLFLCFPAYTLLTGTSIVFLANSHSSTTWQGPSLARLTFFYVPFRVHSALRPPSWHNAHGTMLR